MTSMTEIKLDKYPFELWHCDDERLPTNKEMDRIAPDQDFLKTVVGNGILQPPMMCCNEHEGWFIAFGRKRLMAVRSLYNDNLCDGYLYIRVGVGISKEEAHYLSIIENAQRSGNPLSDFAAIKAIMVDDNTATYKSIAGVIGKPVTYVKGTAEKYALVPDWAIKAALDDKIATSVLEALGSAPKDHQKKAQTYFNENKKLPMSVLSDMRRIQKTEFAVEFAMNTSQSSMKRPVVARKEVEEMLAYATDDRIPTKSRLNKLTELLIAALDK